LPATIEDSVKAEAVEFKQEKRKLIKKEEKHMTEREKLKLKMSKMNPHFREQLRQ